MQLFTDYVDSLPIVSTHEHHIAFQNAAQVCSLEGVLAHGYVGWCGVPFDRKELRGRFLDLVCGNSYFVWYERALDDLFGFGGEITEENWDSISEEIGEQACTPYFHEEVFRSKCRYQRVVQDTYWDPGSDLGRPELYAPTFRVNAFLFGNHIESQDHNGNNPQAMYGRCESLDDYLALIDTVIREKKDAGCVALKSALAYDRSIDFRPQSKRAAERVYGRPPANVAPDELKAFGNFIFDHICSLAAKHNLPLQNHTGLGKLGGSNPMNLIPMIEKHPETRFVLFHGGYPWTEEIPAMLHNYPNVYADLCWLPSICTSAAERTLHSLIEAGRDSSRVTWGGDSWLVTESYAQSLAARHVVKKVLSEKVEQGYLTEARARRWAERILADNARELYGI